MHRRKRFLPSFLAGLTASVFATAAGAETHYVDFSYAGVEMGTSAQPFNTLQEAVDLAGVGDTIYLKGGTYTFTEAQALARLDISGFHPGTDCSGLDPVQMLRIAKDPAGGSVVLRATGSHTEDFWEIRGSECIFLDGGAYQIVVDGDNTAMTSTRSLLHLPEVTDSVVQGLRVRRSLGRGISFNHAGTPPPSANLVLRGNHVTEIYDRSIGGFGYGVTIVGNLVNYTTLSAGTAGTISVTPHSSSFLAPKDIQILGNVIHDSFGEGILANSADGVTIAGNTIYDVRSTGIYLDKTRNVVIDGNYIYHTNDLYNKPGRGPANGITLANEYSLPSYPQPTAPLANVTISNNLVVTAETGISYWNDPSHATNANTYQNVKIYHNVIRDITDFVIQLEDVPAGYPQPFGCEAKNNVFYGGIEIGDESAWTFSHNNFVSGVPGGGTITHTASYAGDPGFVGPSLLPGAAPESFRLAPGSINYEAGTPTAAAADFWGEARHPTQPSVGPHAYHRIFSDSFESGDTSSFSASVP